MVIMCVGIHYNKQQRHFKQWDKSSIKTLVTSNDVLTDKRLNTNKERQNVLTNMDYLLTGRK